MDRIVKRVDAPIPVRPQFKRVCAYARVSTSKDAMLHSLSAQVSQYSSMIQNHPGWLYCGVYTDEGITGTKENRKGFQQMLKDCREGKLDCIITKSISRFARNTVTLLKTVRELKDLGVDVYFEEQNIHSMSSDGELVLTILASYAQEESRSNSENQKWRIRKDFQEGKPWNGDLLGYHQEKDQFFIVPEEAEVVRRIYADYLAGYGIERIANQLNKEQVLGRVWYISMISRVLKNYTYTGNLLLQRYFIESYLTKKKCVNRGELPMYHVEDAHEAIIDADTFLRVQKRMEQHVDKYVSDLPKDSFQFSSKITCAICGKNYRRKKTVSRVIWICTTYNSKGKAKCPSKAIPEETLNFLASDVLLDQVESIVADKDNIVRFCMKDGNEVTKHWEDRSRSESWTPEMRSQNALAAKRGWQERKRKKENV